MAKKPGRLWRSLNWLVPVFEVKSGAAQMHRSTRRLLGTMVDALRGVRDHAKDAERLVPLEPGALPGHLEWPDADSMPRLLQGARVAWVSGLVIASIGALLLVMWALSEQASLLVLVNLGLCGLLLVAAGTLYALAACRDVHSMCDRYYYRLQDVAREPRMWVPFARSDEPPAE